MPDQTGTLSDEKALTKFSGQSSGTIVEMGTPKSDWHGLRQISNEERLNQPCYTEIELMRMPDALKAKKYISMGHNKCGGLSGDKILVGNISATQPAAGFLERENIYISGVQVCNSGQNNKADRRLKGLRIQLREVNEDTCRVQDFTPPSRPTCVVVYSGSDAVGAPLSPRTICDDVAVMESNREGCDLHKAIRTCPDGMIATEVHVNLGDKGASGMRLACREVIPVK